MRNIRQYWQAVRAIEATLPPEVWLVAVDSPGFLTQVAAETAAKMLYAKSHRAATEAEVEAHHTREAAANKSARRERLRRSGAAVVPVAEGEGETSAPTKRRLR